MQNLPQILQQKPFYSATGNDFQWSPELTQEMALNNAYNNYVENLGLPKDQDKKSTTSSQGSSNQSSNQPDLSGIAKMFMNNQNIDPNAVDPSAIDTSNLGGVLMSGGTDAGTNAALDATTLAGGAGADVIGTALAGAGAGAAAGAGASGGTDALIALLGLLA